MCMQWRKLFSRVVRVTNDYSISGSMQSFSTISTRISSYHKLIKNHFQVRSIMWTYIHLPFDCSTIFFSSFSLANFGNDVMCARVILPIFSPFRGFVNVSRSDDDGVLIGIRTNRVEINWEAIQLKSRV